MIRVYNDAGNVIEASTEGRFPKTVQTSNLRSHSATFVAVISDALVSPHFDVPANPKAAQRNQITRKLDRSKFASWILCFCHIGRLAMGKFN
jgi:hypothetical protein